MRRRYYINDEQPLVKYGYLYNWYVTQGTGNASIMPTAMASAGWDIPTFNSSNDYDILTLTTHLGGYSTCGGKLKTTGTTYFNSPNTGATNEVNFNGRGGGYRNQDGSFNLILQRAMFWTKYNWDSTDGLGYSLVYDAVNVNFDIEDKKRGCSIRLVRPLQLGEQTIPDGQPVGTYTGNDGLVYPTVRIGSEVWLACNLAETKLRNGDLIPVVTDNSAWSALTTSAMCYYGNDFNNVFI